MATVPGHDATVITAAIAAARMGIQKKIANLQGALNSPPIPSGPIPFHRSLLTVRVANIIDIMTKEGKKFYKEAAASLLPTGVLFDVEPEMFTTFMNL